jgi:hypothetical protein
MGGIERGVPPIKTGFAYEIAAAGDIYADAGAWTK